MRCLECYLLELSGLFVQLNVLVPYIYFNVRLLLYKVNEVDRLNELNDET